MAHDHFVQKAKEAREFCPCCGYKTLPARNQYEICYVCGWEDDDSPPDFKSAANQWFTIEAYQAQWLAGKHSKMYPACLGPAPLPEERDPDWKPHPQLT
jgi:hypothetical protein